MSPQGFAGRARWFTAGRTCKKPATTFWRWAALARRRLRRAQASGSKAKPLRSWDEPPGLGRLSPVVHRRADVRETGNDFLEMTSAQMTLNVPC